MTEKIDQSSSLLDLLDAYGTHLEERGKLRKAVIACVNPNREFIRYLVERDITKPDEITEEAIKAFQVFLYEHGSKRTAVAFFMQHIRAFFDFLHQSGKVKSNEAKGVVILPEPGSPGSQLPNPANMDGKDSLYDLLDAYSEYLNSQGRSHVTVINYVNPNRQFIRFLEGKGFTKPKEVTEELIKEFQQLLYDERDFERNSVETFMKLQALFFDFVILSGKLKKNPARGIEILPKPEPPETQKAHFYTYEEILRKYMRNQEKWVSYYYLNHIQKDIKAFIKYLRSNEIGSVYPVTESNILKYRQFLWDELVHAREDALVVKSQIRRLRNVVRLFRYLYKEGILRHDPSTNLGWEEYYKDIAKKAKTLPKRPEPEQNLTDMDKLAIKFIDYEKVLGKNHNTLRTYRKGTEIFFKFLAEKGVENLAQVNKRLLLEYYMHMCNFVGAKGLPVSNGYKNHMLWSVKLFFRFLVRFDYLPKDPSLDLECIKEDRGLPRTCMNEKEVFELMQQPRLNHDPLITRNKAMLELLFSTGIRSNELCSLDLEDIDHQNEMVRINTPKGGSNFQRVIPVGKVALEYLNLYLKTSRPALENGDAKALFISYTGHRLKNEAVLLMVKKYAHECGFRKNITTHSLRVTCATLMLRNGADIRYVQEQLGHKKITSTQVYTRLMPLDLKSIHQRCHPREKKAVAPISEN